MGLPTKRDQLPGMSLVPGVSLSSNYDGAVRGLSPANSAIFGSFFSFRPSINSVGCRVGRTYASGPSSVISVSSEALSISLSMFTLSNR